MRFNYVLLSGAVLALPLTSIANTEASLDKQDISATIIGGEKTSLNQLPFFARLLLHRTGQNQFFNTCGGSIVNDRFILTAAHCVTSDKFTNGWNTGDLRVLVKNPTLDDVNISEFKKVSRIILHPDYNESDNFINDIALLELSYPITDNVQSITLPQDFGDYSDVSVYQIFGLGQTSSQDTSLPTYLRWAELEPLPDSECANMVYEFHSQETICANGFEDREYTSGCFGDSGGPLTYVDEEGIYQQIGITSYGSQECEIEDFPSVFTEVLNYTSWIEENTSTGTVTSYDAALAATESYHSEGDTVFVKETSSGSHSSGGALGTGLLVIGGLLGWARRRKQA